MSNLWKNGEYVGWKAGKPWWENHGPHVAESVVIGDESRIVCQICGVDYINAGLESTGTPHDESRWAVLRLTGLGQTFYVLRPIR